jgi:phosphoribosylformylglycinamidine synthase subunit PurS
MPAFTATVHVTLKPGVLDPQATAITQAIGGLAVAGVGAVQMGKFFTLPIEAANAQDAEKIASTVCQQLLANPVMETFKIVMG